MPFLFSCQISSLYGNHLAFSMKCLTPDEFQVFYVEYVVVPKENDQLFRYSSLTSFLISLNYNDINTILYLLRDDRDLANSSAFS